jgi:hypothetical protein
MLHKINKICGLHLHAVDGEIGHVDDFLFDEQTWAIRYLVVDTSNWMVGKAVLVSPSVVTSVDWPRGRIHVSLSRDAIKGSPSLETADIAPGENLPTIWIM